MALTEGLVDKNAIIVGDWSEISIEFPAGSGTWYYIGNCPEGVLEISKDLYQHVSTSFPRKTDLVIPVKTGMKFTGRLEEIYVQNIRLAMGMNPTDSDTYVYIGALTTPTYFKFRARRARNSDGSYLTAVFWKAQSAGLMQLGGADEAVGTPIEVEALDDSTSAGVTDPDNDKYGGSSTSPLGYLVVPAKTT
jgi:hypothetical protein